MIGWLILAAYIVVGIIVAAISSVLMRKSYASSDDSLLVGLIFLLWPIAVIIWALEVLGKAISYLMRKLW